MREILQDPYTVLQQLWIWTKTPSPHQTFCLVFLWERLFSTNALEDVGRTLMLDVLSVKLLSIFLGNCGRIFSSLYQTYIRIKKVFYELFEPKRPRNRTLVKKFHSFALRHSSSIVSCHLTLGEHPVLSCFLSRSDLAVCWCSCIFRYSV